MGQKEITSADGEESYTLPKLIRKQNIAQMYEQYEDWKVSNNKTGVLQTTFFKLVKHITSNDHGIPRGIDYVTTRLVNESVELLKEIIDKTIVENEQKKFSKMLTKTKTLMKHQYSSHLDSGVDDTNKCYHGLDFVLGKKRVDSIKNVLIERTRNKNVKIEGKIVASGFLVSQIDKKSDFSAHLLPGYLIVRFNGMHCSGMSNASFDNMLKKAKRNSHQISFKALSQSSRS